VRVENEVTLSKGTATEATWMDSIIGIKTP
jgi:hypothetical protein